MTTFDIVKTYGRDGIRTRKDGSIALATLEVRGADGEAFTLRIQTRVGAPAVFRAAVGRDGTGTLTAETAEAEALVADTLTEHLARKAGLLAEDAAADAEFGPIETGTPAQIVKALEVRAARGAAEVRAFMGDTLPFWERAGYEQAEGLRELIPTLYGNAVFWLDVSIDLVGQIGRWRDGRPCALATIINEE